MDVKTKGKVINALRRVSWHYAPRNERKKRQKRDKALFECELCSKYCYEGKSQKGFTELKNKYPNKLVEMEKVQADHVSPVIPIVKGWEWSWDTFMNNLFCDIDGYQILCSQCHSIKSKTENEQRKKLRHLTK